MDANGQGQRPKDAFYGGPFDGVVRDGLDLRGATVYVDPDSGESYERTPALDAVGVRAWQHTPDNGFKVTPEQAAAEPSVLGAPVALSTLAVRAADKEHPVNLGQLRQLVASADRMGFTDETPVRAVVFMRGTAKALELRAR